MASLLSLDAAFVIDLVRDIYEAFVIYCFFNLLVEYLGGERSLLILVHGRRPTKHLFPVNLFFTPLDISDPYTFLGLKRGILQYVQVKPALAVLTVVLKSFGKYDEGKLAVSNGYTWVSIVYNFSVFLSLYCLGMFWAGLNDDLQPFRVTSKFLCIKGIIFFSFWQGLAISILVAAGLIRQIGPVRDEQYISLAVQDMLICFEMPLFALGHAYAFSPRDYIDPFSKYQSRLPAYYAVRDAIGMYDVISDSLNTIRGTGYGYQTFEPAEGVLHQGLGRERRSKAGLRYTAGGKTKYWLPQRGNPDDPRDGRQGTRHLGPANALRIWIDRKRMDHEGYAPLLRSEAAQIVHRDPDLEAGEEGENDTDEGQASRHPLQDSNQEGEPTESTSLLGNLPGSKRSAGDLVKRAGQWASKRANASIQYFDDMEENRHRHDYPSDAAASEDKVEFSDVEASDEVEALFANARALEHGDYAFPSVDVGMEEERRKRWRDDEELVRRYKVRRGQRGKISRALGSHGPSANDAEGDRRKSKDREEQEEGQSGSKKNRKGKESEDGKDAEGGKGEAPPGVVDLLVEDNQAEERERLRERRRGDPALRAGQRTRIFRRKWQSKDAEGGDEGGADEEEEPEFMEEEEEEEEDEGQGQGQGHDTYRKLHHQGIGKRAKVDGTAHPDALDVDERKKAGGEDDPRDEGEDEQRQQDGKVETAEVGERETIATEVGPPKS